MNNLKKLEQKHKELGEEIARLKAENDDVWPKDGDEYFFIDIEGEIINDIWRDFNFEKEMLEAGNAFRTREGAEKIVLRRKIETILMKHSRGFVPDWDNVYQNKFRLLIDTGYLVIRNSGVDTYGCTIFFETSEKAETAKDEVIEKLGEKALKQYLSGQLAA